MCVWGWVGGEETTFNQQNHTAWLLLWFKKKHNDLKFKQQLVLL